MFDSVLFHMCLEFPTNEAHSFLFVVKIGAFAYTKDSLQTPCLHTTVEVSNVYYGCLIFSMFTYYSQRSLPG